MTVAGIIEEGLRIHSGEMAAPERERLVIAALREVGMEAEVRHRYPHEFFWGPASAHCHCSGDYSKAEACGAG